MEKIIDGAKVIFYFVLGFGVYFVVCWFVILGAVYLPHAIWASGECLAAGYPKVNTTWDFRVYCIAQKNALEISVVELKATHER